MSDDDRRWASDDLADASGEDGLPLPGHWPHADRDPSATEGQLPAHEHRPTLSLPEAKRATRDRARAFETLLTDYAQRHWPASPPSDAAPAAPPRRVGLHARLLPLLRAVPWALAALFAASFFWDFPDAALSLLGYTLPVAGLLRIITVSGLIGFATNWLAVTMLFQPRQRRPVFGQGLIPAQRERVAWRLAEAISEDLINEDVIKTKIQQSGLIPRYREKLLETTRAVLDDPGFRRELKGLTEAYARSVLRAPQVQHRIADFIIERLEAHAGEGLPGLALNTYRLFNEEDFRRRIDEAVRALPQSVDPALDEMDRLLDRLPAHLERRSDRLEQAATRLVLRFVENLDVYTMVRERMDAYDEQKLEELFKKTSNEQLNYIKYLGGILGALGGLVIWAPLPALIFFTSAGLLLYAFDEILFRARTASAK